MALAAKLAAGGLSGSEVAFVRFAVMMVPIVLVPGLARKAVTFQRLDLLFYRGVFGGTAVLLYFLAMAHIPVGIATLLNYCSPIFSVAFAAFFLGERVDRRLVVPLASALVGVALAAGGGAQPGELLHFGRWEGVGLTSAVLSGAAVTAIRAARRTEGSWAIYGSFTLFGLLATAPFGLAGFRAPSPRQWALLLVVGGCSVIAQLLMTWAYRWVTNLQAGILNQLTVVLSLAFGAIFLGDRLKPLQLLGCLLTLIGIVGVVWLQSTPRAVE
jgi:drug/metabolite transporter (DMT)-like permease